MFSPHSTPTSIFFYKFASSHLWLYSQGCVRLCRKPSRHVFGLGLIYLNRPVCVNIGRKPSRRVFYDQASYGKTSRFVSDLGGNPQESFSRARAHTVKQACSSQTWPETLKTCFLGPGLI